MKFQQTIKKCAACAAAVALACTFFPSANVCAEDPGTISFLMSPMYEKISLDPGESYSSSFTITTPSQATADFNYQVYTQSYYRDENNIAIFEDVEGHSQMVDWITIDSPTTGTLPPDGYATIRFTINVPENAPAGGQYAAITVGTAHPETQGSDDGIKIQESIAMGYTVYAEITGETVKQGEITDINVPSFLFSGNITGSSSIKNTGNVHGDAIYKLQVFPLFSSEEVYTNEENPDIRVVLPDRTLYYETSWDNTPWLGIFNVLYTVEFEGVVSQVSKMVIVCPIWLLFVVIFGIIMLIIWIVLRSKARKTPKKKPVIKEDPVNGPIDK